LLPPFFYNNTPAKVIEMLQPTKYKNPFPLSYRESYKAEIHKYIS